MKINNFLFIAFISILMPRILYAGTAYYVDPSAGTDGNGSYASPWNNIPSVNNYSFSTGDDVYFKVNTTCTLTADSHRLQIDWGGTVTDRAIIGAYYGDGQFGLDGNPRPIIDGDGTGGDDDEIGTYPGDYQAVIEEASGVNISYITVQDLYIRYSGWWGVRFIIADNVNVDNCYFYRPKQNGIVYGSFFGGVDTGIIENNTVERSGYPDNYGGGAAIEVFSGNKEGDTTNITVRKNTVFGGKLEGIGLYKKVTNSIVEHNTVYDINNVGIYLAASQHNTVRHNLIYQTTDYPFWIGGWSGISVAMERWHDYCYSGYNEIYGNFVAGISGTGINLGCGLSLCTGVGTPYAECKGDFSDCVCFENTKIYNNTLVDNAYNIRNWNPDSRDSMEIKNNVSWAITNNMKHAVNFSPAGVTWSHNLFYGNTLPTTGSNARNNAVIGNPRISKTTGWRNLSADSLSLDDFKLTGTASAAHNAGTDLGGTPYNLDYWGTNRDNNAPWDIGAHEYVDVDTTPPAKPTGLIIVE